MKRRGRGPKRGGKGKKGKKGGAPPPLPEWLPELAAFLGVPSDANADLPAGVAAALADGERVRSAVAALEPETRAVLYHLVYHAGLTLQRTVDHMEVLRRIPAKTTKAAIAKLRRLGLVTDCDFGCTDQHPLPELDAIGRDALAFTARALPDEPDPLPLSFVVATVAAYAAQVPPSITQKRTIYARWMKGALACFAHPSILGMTIEVAFDLLLVGDALVPDPEEGQRMLRLDADAAIRVVSSSDESLALAAVRLGRFGVLEPAQVAHAALHRALTEHPEQDDFGIPQLEEAAAAIARLPWRQRLSAAERLGGPGTLTYAAGQLKLLGLVESSVREDGVRVRRAPLTDAPRESWAVLPNLDVLVPARADPAEIIRLGCMARLVSVDNVARFVLEPQAAQRASLLLREPGGDALVQLLTRGASHALPDNVAANVRSWVSSAGVLRPHVGAVVVTEDPLHRQFLVERVDDASEIAPGVFTVPESRLATVLRAAERAGFVVAPIRRAGGVRPRHAADRGGDDVTQELADEERADLVGWATTPIDDDDEPPAGETKWQRAARLRRELQDTEFEPLLAEYDDEFPFDVEWDEPAPGGPIVGGAPWETPGLGRLRTWLKDAAANGSTVEIIYVNGFGNQTVCVVRPINVTVQNRREVVVATSPGSKVETTYYFDKIAGIRG